MKRLAAILTTALALTAGSLPASADQADIKKSDNVKLVKNFPYEGGTDIDFGNGFAYAGKQGNEGGVIIYDTRPRVPKQVGFIPCPGSQNDVAYVKPGLIALGYHSGQCGGLAGAGVRLIDVSNPKAPKYLDSVDLPGGSHTITVYPGEPIIYSSPGGLPVNGGGTEQILDISNPRDIKVVSTYEQNPSGCHDVAFQRIGERMLAFCPGLTEAQIWDVTDPIKPVTIGHAVSPSFFPHAAVPSPDGKYLVLTDEAFGVHDCMGGPTGSVWVFDISVPEAPVFAGHWGPQRGAGISSADGGWCTAHNLNFIPGTTKAVLSWYSGGTSVIDVDNLLKPVEVAWFQPSDADTWSSYWYDGRIYANDLIRGFDVIQVKGLKEGKSR